MLFLPESPKWLLEKGREDEAKRALIQIYGPSRDAAAMDSLLSRLLRADSIDSSSSPPHSLSQSQSAQSTGLVHSNTSNSDLLGAVINEMHASPDRSLPATPSPGLLHSTLKFSPTEQDHSSSSVHGSGDMALLRAYEYPILLIAALQVLAQITGGVVIRNYAPSIFESSGVSNSAALGYNLLLGVVKLLFTVFAVVYIERLGRRLLLSLGACLVALGMLLLTVSSAAASDPQTALAGYIVGCSLCLGGYGVGYGPIPWTLSSEMFPTAVRGRVMSVSLIASNLSQLVTNLCFLPVVDSELAATGTFGLFLLANVFAMVFVRCLLVETRDASPPDILRALLEQRTRVWDQCWSRQNGYLSWAESFLRGRSPGAAGASIDILQGGMSIIVPNRPKADSD
eukprot:gene22580-23786_t